MTDKQRVVMGLQRKLSEARTKLAVIDPVVEADRTEAQRTEYRSINEAMPALETEFRAACEAAEGEQAATVVETRGGDSAEGREYRALIGRSSIPPTKAAELHARIDELLDGGRNTAAGVRSVLHAIVNAQVEAPEDWAPEDWAAPVAK